MKLKVIFTDGWIYNLLDLSDSSDLLRKLKDLVSLLPLRHRKLAAFLAEFLATVASKEVVNKMPLKNLAVGESLKFPF